MEGRCERHQFDRAVDRCGRCGGEYCGTCVVYSFGPKKPPYCLPCAVEAAGVRSGAGSAPAMSRRERKRMEKERAANLQAAAAADAAPPAAEAYDMDWMSNAGTA